MADVNNNDDLMQHDYAEHSTGTGLVLPALQLPEQLHILSVTNRPFFPAQVQPLLFNAESSTDTLNTVIDTEHKMLGICYHDPQTKSAREPIDADNPDSCFPDIGCVVKIHNVSVSEDKVQCIAVGLQRFRIEKWLSTTLPYRAQVKYLHTLTDSNQADEVRAYAIAIINTIKEILPLNPLYSEELRHYLDRFSPNDPSPLTDFAAAITTAKGPALQEVLETIPLLKRMEKVLILIRKELEVVRLQTEITEQVNQSINQHQREFFLKEQMKIIQKELGIAKDDRTADIEQFEERLTHLDVPAKALQKINDELKKMSVLESGSAEYGVTRNYLDWATSVPWGQYSQDNFDLSFARDQLNRDHEALDDIKDRIIEFLAIGAYRQEISGSILLLVGPPGVGKTSIGNSIAQALHRKFYRFSLGGMRDEAEIKGHRRTYVGALPGKLVQALKEVETANPVIMLDEVDKLSSSYQGDPASALLEVLDPEQNHEFLDHYLDMRLDLSKVLFICTANQLDTIPAPLLDRMDTIRLPGYLGEEKLQIARNHLWPKQLKKAGIARKQLKIHKAALTQIIDGYAREAGVRQLDKLLNRIVRKAVIKLLDHSPAISITAKDVTQYLGQPYFHKEKHQRGIGTMTGLAWTSMGGATLTIEASVVHKKRAGFKVTGQLGDVMLESADIAKNYLAANNKLYGIADDFFTDSFIHLHVPAGATPKDGPSAGITIASALLSLARNEKVSLALAMTGELTLTGQVLAVGGIREKFVAAKRIGIGELIIPDACRHDYAELPDSVRDGLTIHFVKSYPEVFALLFA